MARQTDLVVIGAGPAGLAAACSARECGLDVTLVDEHASPGGQIFRNIESPLGRSMLDQKERKLGMALAEEFRRSGTDYQPNTIVWGLDPGKVSCTTGAVSRLLPCSSVVVAPGAMERPVPFPGWTLPGVMSAGGADILLRSGGTPQENPDAPIVLAGNGPLLLLLACHLIEHGANITAWLDTGYGSRRLCSVPLIAAAFLDSPYLGKGFKMAMKIVKAKIPVITGVGEIRAIGGQHLEKVSYRVRGKAHAFESRCLLRHDGIIPRTQILDSLGAAHRWEDLQRYWYPKIDAFGTTSIDGVFLAGDAGDVHGGDAAITKGRLAGIGAARKLGVITESEAAFRAKDLLTELRRIRTARRFLRYLFAPNPAIFKVPDDTTVCRCESVSAGKIRRVVAEGNSDVNEVKLYTRCGMGPCQGRMCGPALAEITADALDTSPERVNTLRMRQPFRPVSLENYCNLYGPEEYSPGKN